MTHTLNPQRYRAVLAVLGLALGLLATSCRTRVTDEDVLVNPVEREIYFEGKYANFRIMGGGWHVDDTREKSYTDEAYFISPLTAGEYAMLWYYVAEDDRYSKTPSKEAVVRSRLAFMEEADRYGVGFNPHPEYRAANDSYMGFSRNRLHGWRFVYWQRQNPRMNTGPMELNYVVCIFDEGRAHFLIFKASMQHLSIETQRNFLDTFDETIATFRLRGRDSALPGETRAEMEARTQGGG